MGNAESTEEMHRLFDKTAQVYDQSGVQFFGPIGHRLIEFAGITEGNSVLDVGCGRGAALFPAAEAVGAQGEAVGIDISEEMAKFATADARERGLSQVTVTAMNGQEPEFPAGRFDAVVGSCSLFIWTQGAAELRPYLRLLKPGGRFATAAPSFFSTASGKWGLFPDCLQELLMPHMVESLKESRGGTSVFANALQHWLASPESIEKALAEAGFTDGEVVEEELPIVADSGAQWVEWTKTTGMRGLWDRLAEGERRELADEVARRLESLRDASGKIVTPSPIVYIRANAPRS